MSEKKGADNMIKVYIIQYQGRDNEDYASSLEAAENYLISRGFTMTQKFNENECEAGCFEFPGDFFYRPEKARIIAKKLIG